MIGGRTYLSACLLLALAVTTLGAWVRLSDAGLACPDWPACYGEWALAPGQAADPARTTLEMLHRVLAGTLGLLILGLGLTAWRQPGRVPRRPAILLCLLVAGQAALGRLTVTQLLAPWIVTAHLLGGLSLLAGLCSLRLRRLPASPDPAAAGLQRHATLALLALAVQVALGGLVSSHGAGLACPDFPQCNGAWWPPFDPLSPGPDNLHMLHRASALCLAALVGALILRLGGHRRWRAFAAALAVLLATQISLGILSVQRGLPPDLALAHHLGASLLLLCLCVTQQRLRAAARARPFTRRRDSRLLWQADAPWRQPVVHPASGPLSSPMIERQP